MKSNAPDRPDVHSRILAEAERLFRLLGYAKTTVADIAAACQMSTANVYRYFDSKATLNEEITEQVLSRLEEASRTIASEQGPAADRLKRLVLAQHRYTCEQYLQESRVHEIVIKAMDEQWAVIDAHIDRLRECFRTILLDGVKQGEFDAQEVKVHAECVFNAVIPFCHPQVVAERYAKDEGRQAALMADFLVSALRARRL